VHSYSTRERIAIGVMPPVLLDIVTNAVDAEPDMEIVARFKTRDQLFETMAGTAIDVVILGVEEPDDLPLAREILRRSRQALLLLSIDGRRAAMYELRPHKEPLGDVSPQGLVAAIRSRARLGSHV
jgi:DNA-binding NarL/FixJ family response regulator